MNDQPLTMGSLFDGSGGFPLAAVLNGIQPLWSSEIEPYPIKVTSKRFPHMKHYGNINELSGKELAPVDIITFGSPCQDMSAAGKRKGMAATCSKCGKSYKITEEYKCPQCREVLEKTRSGLFVEAIRIIKEMRESTNGKYPTFIIWENVAGAYSSNKGEDFRTVLEEICSITDNSLSIPQPKNNKWLKAGEILGDNHSIAWRTLDAQYWGVPQRRKRIYLVADFRGGSASDILFKSARLQRYITESEEPRQGVTAITQESIGKASTVNELVYGIGRTAWSSGVNFVCTPSITENICPTLTTEKSHAVAYNQHLYENHSQDTRYTGPLKIAPTVSATYGMGGNNQPFIVKDGITVVEGTGSRPSHNGDGFKESDVMYTLNTIERHAVAYGIDRAAFNQGINAKYGFSIEEEMQPTVIAKSPGAVAMPTYSSSKASFFTRAEKELANTLVATDYKDPPLINSTSDQTTPQYIVRRLTPTECGRLQGFPDWWTADTETENPTEEEMSFWREVFETHRKAVTGAKKPKTDNQIRKWLREPARDSAKYKMWGNGIALPCAFAVFNGIVKESSKKQIKNAN